MPPTMTITPLQMYVAQLRPLDQPFGHQGPEEIAQPYDAKSHGWV